MRSSATGRLIPLCLLVGIAMLAFAPSAPAASGGACQLQGTASFGSGLNTTAKPFDYSFHGVLSNCQSSVAGSPASGSVSAGEIYTDLGTGKQYQLPRAQGNGSCASSTTSGTAVAFWVDGTRTVVAYNTTGATAAVHLQGSVVASVTVPPVNPADPPLTLTTTRYGGNSANGALVFEASPPECASETGVLAAGIEGTISLGTPN
jgi:hypothetical protein